jgi:hypothetical protein
MYPETKTGKRIKNINISIVMKNPASCFMDYEVIYFSFFGYV